MNLSFKPLEENLDQRFIFLDHMEEVWESRGGGPGIKEGMEEKILSYVDGKLKGWFLFDQTIPIGIGWVEKSTPTYGNITLHSLDPLFEPTLIEFFINNGSFDNALLELVQVGDSPTYRKVLLEKGLIENYRQRMCLWLNENTLFEAEQTEATLIPYNKEHGLSLSQISVDAHLESKDYEMYDELTKVEPRYKLEQKVLNGLYGPINWEASFIQKLGNEIIGFCLVIDVRCWGHEKVPWIFDISVKPEHHSKGFGRSLFKTVVRKLTEMNYPIMGLAVTKSNGHAIRLYEKLGFQLVDEFSEFMNKV